MKCKQCGEEVEVPFRCNFCQNYYCSKHRLPEIHECSGAPARVLIGSSQSRKEMDILRSQKKQPSNLFSSASGKSFVSRELPTFKFNKSSKKKTKLNIPRKKRR